MAALQADTAGVGLENPLNLQLNVIWQMALASFSVNNNCIVLPLQYEKLLSAETVEELKNRLSRHLGCQTFVLSDPATSTFRIFGLAAPAVEALAQLAPNNLSLAGSPLESIINQTKLKYVSKEVSDDDAMNQQAGNEKQVKIPRPPNAFILYRQEYHPLVKAEHPEFHNNDISRLLGKQWQEESPAVRALYKAKALERKAEHLKMHPGYQYAPRKPGVKKRRTSRKDTEAGADKEQYESLHFIDQENDFYGVSESGSNVDDDAMDVIGTKQDDGARRFHVDSEENIGVILPVSENVNVTKMIDGNNKRAVKDGDTSKFNPYNRIQVSGSEPPHVQNDTDFFDALIDWEGIAEDFKIVREISGEDIAGVGGVETGNPYLHLSDEDQRALFEAELARTLKYFD